MSDGDVRKSKATAPSVERFVWPENCKRMRDAIALELKLMGVIASDADLERIVNTPAIRDVFIVSIYNSERARGEKAEYLFYRLGDLFALGHATVRSILRQSRQR